MKALLFLTFVFVHISLYAGDGDITKSMTPDECQTEYNKLSYAGVKFQSDVKPDCADAAGFIAGCNRFQTRIPFRSYNFEEDTSGWRVFNSRGLMCVDAARIKSSWRNDYCMNAMELSVFKDGDGKALRYRWEGSSDYKVGKCMCKPYLEGALSNQAKLEYLDCTSYNPYSRFSRKTAGPNGTPLPGFETKTESIAVEEKKTAHQKSPPKVVDAKKSKEKRDEDLVIEVNALEPMVSPEMISCIEAESQDLLKSCQQTKTDSYNACDNVGAKKTQIAADSGQKISSVASEYYIDSKKGSGSQHECLTAATMALGARELATRVNDECKTKIESCKVSCGQNSVKNLSTLCESHIKDDLNIEKNREYLKLKLDELANQISEMSTLCDTIEAQRTSKKGLNELVSDMGDMLNKSATCSCKLSNNPKAFSDKGCDSIPTPESCGSNPHAAGCKAYATVEICSKNSASYNEKICTCSMNSNAPGCGPSDGITTTLTNNEGPKLENSQGPSNFAGSGGAPGGGSGKGTNVGDLNTAGKDDVQPVNLSADKKASVAGAPGGGVASMGNGPIGGSSGGGGDTGAAAEDLEGEKPGGIKGFLMQAKTFVAGLLGMKPKKGSFGNGNATGKNAGFDPNKFKPRKKREVASEDEFVGGSANMDIWVMMTKCTSGESCNSNVNGYLPVDP